MPPLSGSDTPSCGLLPVLQLIIAHANVVVDEDANDFVTAKLSICHLGRCDVPVNSPGFGI